MWFLAFEKRFGYRGEFNHGDRLSERFFLSSALRKQHAFVIGAVCVVIDVSLIFSVGVLIQEIPLLITFAGYFGALCLFVYGLLAFKRALSFVGLDHNQSKK
jgi:L-lysine exporter family protein LysE/ArgO